MQLWYFHNLTRTNRFECIEDRIHERRQILELVGTRPDQNNGNTAARQALLAREPLIDRQQHVVTRRLGQSQ